MYRRLELFLALLCAVGFPANAQDRPPHGLAITHVTLVDVRTGKLVPDATVLIKGSRVRAVGKTGRVRLPRGVTVVDGREKYLIPGLIESHAHHFMQWWRQPADSLAYFGWILASGVTTTRDALAAGNEAEWVARREAQRAGRLIAPRIYVSALVDSAAIKRLGTGNVRETVARFKEMGVDGIKIRNDSPEFRLEVIREAKRAGLPVYGHAFPFVLEAVRAGISGIMHLDFYLRPGSPSPVEGVSPERLGALWVLHAYPGWLEADERETEELIDSMVARGVWLEPTLTLSSMLFDGDRYDPVAVRRYHPWYGSEQLPFSPEERATVGAALRRMYAFVRRFHEKGGVVLAGTDHVPFPPLGVTEEMRRLVEDAGLPPLAALRAATIDPARALQMERDIGSLEKGKLADMVLLDANPLLDITNVRRVSAVIADGRLLDRPALAALLGRTATPLPNK